MRKVPRNACMNQEEFNQMLQNLELFGFDLDVESIPNKFDEILGKFADNTADAICDLIFFDKIYANIIDFKKGHRKEPVYYRGVLINPCNIDEYKNILSELVEDSYAKVDKNIYELKIAIKKDS